MLYKDRDYPVKADECKHPVYDEATGSRRIPGIGWDFCLLCGTWLVTDKQFVADEAVKYQRKKTTKRATKSTRRK